MNYVYYVKKNDIKGGLMTMQSPYLQKESFINRQNELDYLYQWIQRKAQHILFIYGPKSSGKTTLLMKFIENHLNHKSFNIKHFNLRRMMIGSYIDFIQAFFEIDYTKASEDVKTKREYSLKVFKLSKEIKKSLENKSLDPFVVMEKELVKLNKKGMRPVIIIDELQALEDIYMNDQRELLKELFNFFVAMTKESQLCHVIIASSDGYFLNKIYHDSKLSKTSAFYEVDYLPEADVRFWLSNLDHESGIKAYQLTNEQIETIWKHLGGSMFEISYVMGELIPKAQNKTISNAQLMDIIQKLIIENCGKLSFFATLHENKRELFRTLFEIYQEKQDFTMNDLKKLVTNQLYEIDELKDELNQLVQMNILSYNPVSAEYQLQGHSMYYGLKLYVETFLNA
jgi:hypothetical protein